jgi:hypothetical protein
LSNAPAARCSAISYQQGTPFGYNLNSGNAKKSSPALHVVMEEEAFGLCTEKAFLQSAKNAETKSLRISQHKWIFLHNLMEGHDVGPQFGLQLKTEESGMAIAGRLL